jgi:hypothetical protein
MSNRFESFNQNKFEINPLIECPELANLLVSQDLLSHFNGLKRTTFFMTDTIHTHDIFCEPKHENDSNELKYYEMRYQDREYFYPTQLKNGDFSIKFIYYPNTKCFQITGITAEAESNPYFNLYKREHEDIAELIELLKSIENANNETFEKIKRYDKFNILDHYLEIYSPNDNFNDVYKILKSGNLDKIKQVLRPHLSKLIAVKSARSTIEHRSSSFLKVIYGQIMETLYRVNSGMCIKNPTQEQVIKIKNELANKSIIT